MTESKDGIVRPLDVNVAPLLFITAVANWTSKPSNANELTDEDALNAAHSSHCITARRAASATSAPYQCMSDPMLSSDP